MSESKHRFLHELFQKHAHEVRAFLSRRWPREQDIADIVQEAFLRLSQYPNPHDSLAAKTQVKKIQSTQIAIKTRVLRKPAFFLHASNH